MMENIDIEMLINLVQLKPYIYYKGDKRYRDTKLKENAWIAIADTLGCEPSTCEKNWKSLKEKFGRERKKIKSTPSGSGCSSVKTWVWYNDLMFLDGCMQERRKTSSNLKNKEKQIENLNCDSEDFSLTAEFIDNEKEDNICYIPPMAEFTVDENEDYTQSTTEFAKVNENEDDNEEDTSVDSSLQLPLNKNNTTTKGRKDNTEILRPKTNKKRPNEVDLKIIETLDTISKRPKKQEAEEEAFGRLVGVELSRIKDPIIKKNMKKK